jgi:type IV secretory pathway VirB10-like protein
MFEAGSGRFTLLLALALVATGLAAPAVAQWAWKDDNGRVVYSDRPPPSSVKADRIVKQPANAQVGLPPSQSAAATQDGAAKPPSEVRPAAAAPAPRSPAEQEMEFRKRQQERADAERKAQDEQTKAAAKAADCERARGYLKALEEGQRIARTDAAGNREFLDDSQRAAEAERARRSIQATCS